MSDAAGYPDRWEGDVALADGGTVHVRPIRPDDAERLAVFHQRQSAESIYYRFFSPRPQLSQHELERFTNVDYVDRMAFVALLGEELIGMATYDRWRNRDLAEVSFIVDDDHQGRGLATVLLEYLIVAAREVGLRALTASVLPDNRKMLRVFHSVGFETSSSFESGVVEVGLSLEPTPDAQAAIEDRARRSEARSVARLLAPESVAVIGAGRSKGSVGHAIFRSLLEHGYTGAVYPVNTSAEPVASVRSYPSVLDVPDDVDLAVISVPAFRVLDAVEDCGRKGVGGLVIVSSGFEQYGPYGVTGTRLIVERARRFGMRVIGPESLGIINTAASRSMYASFAEVDVIAGRVGFLTQSGTLGAAALEHAQRVGVGISAFVDAGAKVDVSGNDLLQFWEDDSRTDVIALYLNSFGNPRKFTRIARRLGRTKPIVAVKSTGAWTAPDIGPDGDDREWPTDATVGAMLAQSGVIRVDTPVELFDVARLLVSQPVPPGRRTAVLSNSQGAANLTVDACRGAGLRLADLSGATRAALSADLPRGAAVTNPVDLTYQAGAPEYEHGLRALLADDDVDVVVVIYAPSFPRRTQEVARAIGAATSAVVEQATRGTELAMAAGAGAAPTRVTPADKPIVGIFLGADIGQPLAEVSVRVPLFAFPSEAVRALGQAATYGEWRRQPEGVGVSAETFPDLDLDAAARRVMAALGEQGIGGWLDDDATAELLEALGIPLLERRLAGNAREAGDAAEQIGLPVVLKARGLERPKPGEDGGAALSLYGRDDVEEAYLRMEERFGDHMRPAVVQRMATGAEVLAAGHQHPSFGGVVTVGLGGPAVVADRQRPVRILPLTDADASRLVESSPVASALEDMVAAHHESTTSATAPHGGAGATELVTAQTQVQHLLLRLSVIIEHLPEVADLVLNPVIVGPAGVGIADGRVRLAPYRYDHSPAVRRL